MKIKKLIIISSVIILIVLSAGYLFVVRNSEKLVEAQQSKTFGRVNVLITPQKVSSGGSIFDVSLSNHEINLTYNFKEIIKLTDDKGNSYSVADWKSEGEGTHHVNGKVTFGPVKAGAKEVSLEISGIDNTSGAFKFPI